MICPFCNIDKERTIIIKEGKNAFVCLSNPRLVEGHLLVVPKRHLENISELNKEEREEMFGFVVDFQRKILENISEGCDVRWNYRPFKKQDDLKVDHFHIHLIPRSFKDELYTKSQIFEKEIFRKLTQEEIDKIVNLLK